MNTCFHVSSNRIHSMSVAEGTTVASLKEMLRLNGFDVDDTTKIEVHRADDDVLMGAVGTYRLGPGDCVRFITRSIQYQPEPEKRVQPKTRTACACAQGPAIAVNRSAAVTPDGRVTVKQAEGKLVIEINL